MGNDDPDSTDESAEEALTLPSLGFGRKRKRRDEDAEPPTEPVEEPVDQPVEEPATEPVAAPVAEPVAEPVEQPAAEPVREPVAKRVADAFRRTADDEPTRVQEPVAAGRGWSSMTGSTDDTETTTVTSTGDGGGGGARKRPSLPRPRASGRELSVGGLPGRAAAAMVGVLAGLLMVGGTMLVRGGCELARGTSACGGGPGFLLTVALLAAVVVAGAVGLRLTGVPYGGTISFLGVGLVVVVALFFLLGVILSPLMAVVVPLLTGASFVLAHGLSASFGEWSGPDWR